jgi:hypothetical protein
MTVELIKKSSNQINKQEKRKTRKQKLIKMALERN